MNFFSIRDALRDLVPFVQFKNVKNTHGGVLLLVKWQAFLLKVTFLHGCFSRFYIVQIVPDRPNITYGVLLSGRPMKEIVGLKQLFNFY